MKVKPEQFLSSFKAIICVKNLCLGDEQQLKWKIRHFKEAFLLIFSIWNFLTTSAVATNLNA